MIKLEETKDVVIYHVHSIGRVEIKKNYKYNELLNYPVTKVRETDTDITYRMPDEMLCSVSKKLQISIKEVIIRYYILKNFRDNNIYINSRRYLFKKSNHITIRK